MFVIQYFEYPSWNHKWVAYSERYETLKEVQVAFDKLPFKMEHRIAKEYTVVRYKPVEG